jgi:hypothetical protein
MFIMFFSPREKEMYMQRGCVRARRGCLGALGAACTDTLAQQPGKGLS